MEDDAIIEMLCRSVQKHGVKYVKYIGDGDTKTFKGILDMDPYDGDPVVEKKECVGHFQKRMRARLRKAKKDNYDTFQPILANEQDLYRIYFTIYFKSVLEHNVDYMTTSIRYTKSSSFSRILHNIGQHFGRYSSYFGLYVTFKSVNCLWLAGINFAF